MGHTTWLGLGQPNGSSRFQPRCRAAFAAVMCQAGGATSKGTGVVTLFCSARSSSAHRSRLAAASPSVGALQRPVEARSCTGRLGGRLGPSTTKKIRAERKGGGVRRLHRARGT
jgi:hypothetical protein